MNGKFHPARWMLVAGLVLAAALAAFSPALAQSDTQSGEVIVVDEDSPDDLYLAGRDITVNGDVDGDLVVVGQTVVVNGTVTGDVIFGGQSLVINGTVEDDLRGGGMVIKIAKGGSVGDDANVAGYVFEMDDGTSVGGKVYGAGAMITLADVAQDVAVAGSSLRVNGTIGGDVKASVGGGGSAFDPGTMMGPGAERLPAYTRIPDGLTFGNEGKISGDLDYSADSEASLPSNVVGGKVTFTQEERRDVTQRFNGRGGAGRDAFGAAVRTVGHAAVSFVLLMLVGLVLQRFAPNFLDRSVTALKTRLAASFGYGLLGYAVAVGILIGLFVLFLLLIIPFAVAGGAGPFIGLSAVIGGGTLVSLWVLLDWVAPLVVALVLGGWVMKQFNQDRQSAFWTLIVGLLLVIVAQAVPIGGALASLLIGVLGFGAVIATRFPAKPAQPVAVVAETPAAAAPSDETAVKPAARKAKKSTKK